MTSALKAATALASAASAGLATSPENAPRRGLAIRHSVVLACEDPDEFEEHRLEYHATYASANPIEHAFVEEMAVARWRIARLRTIEIALFDAEMSSGAPESGPADGYLAADLAFALHNLADESKSLTLIDRREASLERVYNRAYKNLRELQRDRRRVEHARVQPEANLEARSQEPPNENAKRTQDYTNSNVLSAESVSELSIAGHLEPLPPKSCRRATPETQEELELPQMAFQVQCGSDAGPARFQIGTLHGPAGEAAATGSR